MNKQKIMHALLLLFKAKNKIIDDNNRIIIETWIALFEEYNFEENSILTAIKKLIIKKTPYGFEFADLYELMKPKINYDAIVSEQWKEIINACKGREYTGTKEAKKIFYQISSFDEYGYSTNEYEKSQTKKRFLEQYKKYLMEVQDANFTEIDGMSSLPKTSGTRKITTGN